MCTRRYKAHTLCKHEDKDGTPIPVMIVKCAAKERRLLRKIGWTRDDVLYVRLADDIKRRELETIIRYPEEPNHRKHEIVDKWATFLDLFMNWLEAFTIMEEKPDMTALRHVARWMMEAVARGDLDDLENSSNLQYILEEAFTTNILQWPNGFGLEVDYDKSWDAAKVIFDLEWEWVNKQEEPEEQEEPEDEPEDVDPA
ncbi:hypothetical protein HD806DRAFT_527923 [Xylariaceae sp. AK1471]|nr:hypothetical protein HD806DRAFT_527923 [Xylariaceae sp. AK1471]